MAEEMAETKARDVNSRNRNRGRRDPRSAPKSASNNELITTAVETGREAGRNNVEGEHSQQCAPSKAPVNFTDEMRAFLKDHFNEILEGVLEGVKEGSVSGAKLLLDHCNLQVTGSDQEGYDAARGISVADAFGDDVDWDYVARVQARVSNGVAEHPAHPEPGGVETQLTIARGA